MNLIKKIRTQLYNNLNRFVYEGLGLTIFLMLIILVLSTQIFRVFRQAENNSNVFEYEQSTLIELEEKNNGLREVLQNVSSDEYARLLAKDVFGLAEQNQELYRTKDDIEIVRIEKELFKLDSTNSFLNWWLSLLKL